jgi:hypothetical protein
LGFLPIPFIFWLARHLLINASSLKLWQPIITTFYVPCPTMWKHVASSLWMNASDLIFWLFFIHNPLKLTILTPHHSPCTPSANCANTFIECINTSVDYADKSINLFAHTSYDYANKSANLANTPNTLT